MRTSRNHVELWVSEDRVDVLLAPHMDVDRTANALSRCLDALAAPATARWRSRDGGQSWGAAFILDTPVAQSLMERHLRTMTVQP